VNPDPADADSWAFAADVPSGDDAASTEAGDPGGSPPQSAALRPGERVGDRFRIAAPIGRGAQGAVFRARDDVAGRDVALKLLLADLSERARARFRREGEVMAGLSHPGIVRVYSAGEHAGVPYLAFELVEDARSLADAWDELDRPARLGALRDVAEALGHAHARGLVHRDVKPANVLLDPSGRARVTDFGLAWAERLERLTRTGAFVGTPIAMAPEQLFAERATISPATDVWALGVVLYRALTDAYPFPGPDLVHLAAQVGRGPERPRALDRTVSPALEAACLRCLARDPRDRYPDGRALARALDAALARPRPDPRRRAARLAVGLAALTTIAAVVVGVTRPAPRAPKSPPADAAPADAASPTDAPEPPPAGPPPGAPALAPAPLPARCAPLQNAGGARLLGAWGAYVPAHPGTLVSKVVLTGDGHVLTAANDGLVVLWELATGRRVQVYRGFSAPVYGVGLTPDGRRVVGSGRDGDVRVWARASGEPLATLVGHEPAAWDLDVLPDGRVLSCASGDGSVRLWDLDQPGAELVRTYVTGGAKGLMCVTADPRGEFFLAGGDDGTLDLWSVEGDAAAPAHRLVHADGVLDVACARDAPLAAAVDRAGWLVVWDLAAGEAVARIRAVTPERNLAEGFARCVWLGPDGRRALVGGDDGAVRLWDVATGRELRALTGHFGWVNGLDRQDDTLVTTGSDGTVRRWDLERWTEVRGRPGHLGPVSRVLHRSAEEVVSTGYDGAVRRWAVATGRPIAVAHDPAGEPIIDAALGPERRRLFTAGSRGSVHAWDLATGGPPRLVGRAGARLSCLAAGIGLDGPVLAAADRRGRVFLWPAAGGADPRVLRLEGAAGLDLEPSPDGAFYTCGVDAAVHLVHPGWAPGEPRVARRWGPFSTPVADVEPLTDGRLLTGGVATRGQPGAVAVSGAEREQRLFRHPGGVADLAVDPTERRAASAGLEGVVALHDLAEAGPPVEVDVGATWDRPRTLAFSPDGRELLVGTDLGVILRFAVRQAE